MKANSLEELVTNSNIAGELRNYTDWHTRLMKFAQLVADWQKEQMMKDAVETTVENWNPDPHPEITIPLNPDEFVSGDKVRIIIVKED